MIASTLSFSPPPDQKTLHLAFLALLPRVELHARVTFRHLQCAHRKEEAVAEVVALAWLWCLRLTRQGKDVTQFPSALAAYAARAVRSGRRLCGQEKAQDVLSPLAQQRCGFTVGSLPEGSSLTGNVFDETLADNTVTPVDEQVCFRLDFPAWLATLADRDRRIALDLMVGERTLDVADKHRRSPGRISQLRAQLRDGWLRFQNGRAGADARPAE